MSHASDKKQIVIRLLGESDMADLLQLYEDAGITGEANFTIAQAVDHLKHLQTYPSYRVWGAFDGARLVGTYELLIMDNMAKAGAKSAVVEDVAVAPSAQGRGIGRIMMRHAQEQARQAKCYKLVLSSNKKRVEAHRFYEVLGFEQHGFSFRVDL